MAKFDTYTLSVQTEDKSAIAKLSLTLLFEDGDNIEQVIENARLEVEKEAVKQKNLGFPGSISP